MTSSSPISPWTNLAKLRQIRNSSEITKKTAAIARQYIQSYYLDLRGFKINMTMPPYTPPYATPPAHAPTATRRRGSSVASRYVPDGYPLRPSPEQADYLKPGFSHPQPTPANQELQLYTPPVPEQYDSPAGRPGVPAAQQQLQPYYQDVPSRRMSEAGELTPHSIRRDGSVASHRSDSSRSQRSYYSARSRRSNTVGQSHLDMEHERQQRERARSVQHDSAPRHSHESRPPHQTRKRSRTTTSNHGLPYREPHRA